MEADLLPTLNTIQYIPVAVYHQGVGSNIFRHLPLLGWRVSDK